MNIRKNLEALERVRLVRLALSFPEIEYAFRHALIQEAAYYSLLNADRRSLHGRVARIIEREHRDQIDQVASLVAGHYMLAGENEPALRYYLLAGDFAASKYANAEAAAHYGEALRLALALEKGEDQLIALCDSYGRALELTGKHEDAEQHYIEMEEWGSEHGMASLRLGAIANRAVLYATLTPISNLEWGQVLCEQALAVARELGDRTREVQALNGLVHAHQYLGQTDRSYEFGREAIEIARKLDLKEQLATTLNDVCYGRQFAGHLRLAEELLSESVSLWREIGNLPMLTNALTTLGGNNMYQGQYRVGLDLADEAVAIADRMEDRWAGAFGRMLLGGNYHGLGLYGRAMAMLQESVAMSQAAGVVATEVYSLRYLGSIYGEIGAVDAALSSLQDARVMAEEHLPYMLLNILSALVSVHLQRGEFDRAREAIHQAESLPDRSSLALFNCFLTIAQIKYAWQTRDAHVTLAKAKDALETIETFGLHSETPRVRLLEGRALMALGRNSEGLAALEKGHLAAESMASNGLLWPLLYELWRAAVRDADSDKANLYIGQARVTIREIVSDLPEDFQRQFLKRSRVQAILSGVNRG